MRSAPALLVCILAFASPASGDCPDVDFSAFDTVPATVDPGTQIGDRGLGGAADESDFEEMPAGFLRNEDGRIVKVPGAVVLGDVTAIRSPIGHRPSGSAYELAVVEYLAGDCPPVIEVWSSACGEIEDGTVVYRPATGDAQELPAIGQRLLISVAPSIWKEAHSDEHDPEKTTLWWPDGEYWVVPSTTTVANVERVDLFERTGFSLPTEIAAEDIGAALSSGESITNPAGARADRELHRMLGEYVDRLNIHESAQRWRVARGDCDSLSIVSMSGLPTIQVRDVERSPQHEYVGTATVRFENLSNRAWYFLEQEHEDDGSPYRWFEVYQHGRWVFTGWHCTDGSLPGRLAPGEHIEFPASFSFSQADSVRLAVHVSLCAPTLRPEPCARSEKVVSRALSIEELQ